MNLSHRRKIRNKPQRIEEDPRAVGAINLITSVGCGTAIAVFLVGLGLSGAVAMLMLVVHYLPIWLGW